MRGVTYGSPKNLGVFLGNNTHSYVGMITIKQIRGGRDYFGNHLSANDYYSEGERVTGHWRGKLADMLGLEGKEVVKEDFESLRNNLHPQTGEKLRPKIAKVTFHDVVVSAPKGYSILALVGGDERLVKGFERAVEKAFKRLEKVAGARDRSGDAYHTEKIIRTGNGAAAVFHHNTSRLLDPQLHAHLVFSNHTFSPEKGGYLALQPKVMMDEAKRWITDQFHRDLAKEAIKAGYAATLVDNRLKMPVGLKLEYKFSKRTRQRRKFEKRYRNLFGHEPDKKRIEQFIKDGREAARRRFKDEYRVEFGKWPSKEMVGEFVRDWRSAKMATSSREKVYQDQRAELTGLDAQKLDAMVEQARSKRESLSESMPREGNEEKQDAKINDDVVSSDYGKQQKAWAKKKKVKTRQQQLRERPDYRHAVGRMEAMRRMRRGMAVAQALRGHPMVFMLQQFSTLTRQRRQ